MLLRHDIRQRVKGIWSGWIGDYLNAHRKAGTRERRLRRLAQRRRAKTRRWRREAAEALKREREAGSKVDWGRLPDDYMSEGDYLRERGVAAKDVERMERAGWLRKKVKRERLFQV